MRNEALIFNSRELNMFTTELKRRCQLHGHVICKTLNREFFTVKYTPPDPKAGNDHDMFESVNTSSHSWGADGSSIQNRDYDLFEFDGEPLLKRGYNIIEEILKHENIAYTVITDVPTLMIYSKGHMNPAQAIGFHPHGFGQLILFNLHQTISFLNKSRR